MPTLHRDTLIIMNLSQEMNIFGRCKKWTSAMKLRPEKVIVDFKFDALYR